MEKVQISDNVSFSKIVQGFWRLADWKMTRTEIVHFVEQCIDMGITTFDHADIYGDYSCEGLFGEALGQHSIPREQMQLVTKCGIKLVSDKRPHHESHYYDTSKDHILFSVNQSLKNLQTDYIDVVLIHRPDPFMNPEEVAAAFSQLREEGKVLQFGVSNFSPSQFDLLSSYLDFPLVTNQLEISVSELSSFQNGSIDQCMIRSIPPMAWSPLSGGTIFHAGDAKSVRLRDTLQNMKEQLEVSSMDQLMYAWLLNHPANIMPIVGSGKIARVESAVKALDIHLTRHQWFDIWKSSEGKDVE